MKTAHPSDSGAVLVQQRRLAVPFHDRDFVDHDFSPERIEDEGLRLLYRALNAGRAVGFIGSGVSSAFGRPTWSSLIELTIREIRNAAAKRGSREAPAVNGEGHRISSAAQNILDQVKGAGQSGVSDPDFLPLLAHLIRIEDAQMRSHEGDATSTRLSSGRAEDAVQSIVKRITRDDDVIAREAWKEFVSTTEKASGEEEIAFYRWLDSWGGLTFLLLELDLRELGKAVAEREGARQGVRLSAEERILAPLLLAVVRSSLRSNDGTRSSETKLLKRLWAQWKRNQSVLVDSNKPDARRCKVMDPVRLIVEELGIRRLITTNYDFELELGLERLGFQRNQLRPPFKSRSVTAPDILEAERAHGGRARVAVLKRETAAELASFAVGANPHDYEVFHLHGRAVDGPGERLVITEPDYQDVYMRDAPEAHVMSEALTATMAGNPLVFIGMGMLEGDFLRPLRQFVAGPGARINRNIIALLPAEVDRSSRAKTALHLHLRYGVHAIFYGMNSSKDAEEAPLYLAIDELSRLRRALDAKTNHLNVGAKLKACRAALRAFCGEAVGRAHVNQISEEDVLLWASMDVAVRLLDRASFLSSRDARSAMQAYLRELEGRIRTRALVHALRGHANGRMTWWRQWRELPKHRVFLHTVEALKGLRDARTPDWQVANDADDAYLHRASKTPVRIIRYRVEGEDFGNLEEFETILHQIRRDEGCKAAGGGKTSKESKPKRRVFVVHGDAGSGRGTLFHYLADHFAGAGEPQETSYDWGLFTNANFSTEYSSVVDGVIHFLMRCTKSRAEQMNEPDLVKLPRRDAVSTYLKRIFATHRVGAGMFVIGGAELLFRGEDGVAKNSEIVDALAAFLDEDSTDYPMDVILICRTDKCKAIFGEGFDVAADSKMITATFGHAVEIGDNNQRSRPMRCAPEFVARVLKLKAYNLEQAAAQIERSVSSIGKASRTGDVVRELKSHGLTQTIEGRFASSIIIACANEVKRGGLAALKSFCGALSDALSRVEVGKKSDAILAVVLDQYTALYAEDNQILPDLFHLILKHVAIMAGPIELAVLASCPEIKECCQRLGKKEPEVNQILGEHLRWLVERRLLFELRSREEFRGRDQEFRRYAAHKNLQSYFFHRLGAPFLELGDARLFNVSLFASQGTNLPAPSHSAFKFLRDLIRTLIGYPTDSARCSRNRSEAERRHDVCALRAAVSLTRSAFSFAVVSRFSDFDEAPWLSESRFGFFEQYRLLLRWMIYRAGSLADERTQELNARFPPHLMPTLEERRELKYRFNALYQDEITWLYNECGIVALAQGNLNQAQRLFDQALISNRLIEIGSDAGPNAMRIRLNQAVVQIEQADLKGANAALRSIHQASFKEPVVNAVTRGYRGLVAHLRGRSKQAGELYAGAIEMLRSLGEARALSIFRKHHADLKRKIGDTQGCRLDLLAALAEAEAARQNDQIHRVQISLALCDMAEQPAAPNSLRRIFRRLDEAIRYADRMEIPFLKAEALLARTQAIHRQGETRAAAEEAVKAMAIASLFGQRLRAITALGRLGEVVADRPGHEAQGERMLMAAGKMADASEYQLAKWNIGEGLIRRPRGMELGLEH